MDRKIRVGAVSYLNTKPLVYGFEKGLMHETIDLSFAYPALIARQLIGQQIDIGLVPVAVMSSIPNAQIISDYCIGASAPVASVCLFSQVPIHEVTDVLMDYQSRTSAALLKVLMKHHWKIAPALHDTSDNYQKQISGSTAGLIIGDRALQQRVHSAYIYDLAEHWTLLTGLPFVFAAWVATLDLPPAFKAAFNEATGMGLLHLNEIVRKEQVPYYDLKKYYTSNIDYVLDDAKREGLKLFLQYLETNA